MVMHRADPLDCETSPSALIGGAVTASACRHVPTISPSISFGVTVTYADYLFCAP